MTKTLTTAKKGPLSLTLKKKVIIQSTHPSSNLEHTLPTSLTLTF